MSTPSDRTHPAATTSLRTPEQLKWIRDRFKPDGLARLARAEREYADEHGHYLPDVAALAYDEWERAERLRDALNEIIDMPIDEAKSAGFHFAEVRRIAREAMQRGA